MKKGIHALMLLVVTSCASYKVADFNDKTFVSEPTHMVGRTELSFHSDSLFVLKKMDGNLYSTGKWCLSGDKIFITSSSENSEKRESKDTEIPQLPFFLNFVKDTLLIKSEKKLLYDHSVLLRRN